MNPEQIFNELKLPAPSQVCVVVKDLEQATKRFQILYGVGPFVFPVIKYSDITYRGRAAEGRWEMAFARWGELELELACPLTPPSIYQDCLDENGEGFHHFGFGIKGLDNYLEFAAKLGIEPLMSGRTSMGGFAHLDTLRYHGVLIELIERTERRV